MDEALLLEVAVLRVELIGGRCEREIAAPTTSVLGARRCAGPAKRSQSYGKVVGEVEQERCTPAVALALVEVRLAERRIIDVTGHLVVEAAEAKCGAIADGQVDHAPRPSRCHRGDILAAGLDSRGELAGSGALVTNLRRPPSLLAPYRVPCGPRNTSMRCMSQVSKSPVKTEAVSSALLEPKGESSR